MGICHICGGVAEKRCKMCGRAVCDKHYDSKSGLCDSCKRGRFIK